MSKRRNDAADAEVRPEEAPVAESKLLTIVPIAEVSSDPEPQAIEKTVMEWAQAKGHVPRKGPIRFAGDIHRGPHFRVVMVHAGWPSNKLVTEEAYEAAVKGAYSIPLVEGGVSTKE